MTESSTDDVWRYVQRLKRNWMWLTILAFVIGLVAGFATGVNLAGGFND